MNAKYLRIYADTKSLSAADKEKGILRAVTGSDETIDRYGEIIDSATWQLEHYLKNPVLLWAHNLTFGEDRPAIGKSIRTWVEDKKLKFDLQYDLKDPFAADIYRKYIEGYLSMFSVGFIPHTIERIMDDTQPNLRARLKNNELLELSAVPVPANPNASKQLRLNSFRTSTWDELVKAAEDGEKPPVEPAPAPKDKSKDEKPEPATDEKNIDAVAGKVIEKIMPDLTKTITDVVTAAIKPKEDKGGSGSLPTKQQQGGGKTVRLIREVTKMLQEGLAEYNASLRK